MKLSPPDWNSVQFIAWIIFLAFLAFLVVSASAECQTWTDPDTGIEYSVDLKLSGSYAGGPYSNPVFMAQGGDYRARATVCNTTTPSQQYPTHGALAFWHYEGLGGGSSQNMDPWVITRHPEVGNVLPAGHCNWYEKNEEHWVFPGERWMKVVGCPTKTDGTLISHAKIEDEDVLNFVACERPLDVTTRAAIGPGHQCLDDPSVTIDAYPGQQVEYTVCVYVQTDADFVSYEGEVKEVRDGGTFFIKTSSINVGEPMIPELEVEYSVLAWVEGGRLCAVTASSSWKIIFRRLEIHGVPFLSGWVLPLLVAAMAITGLVMISLPGKHNALEG